MSQLGYYPNYFSIDDIMVTQEKVPCVVETNLPGMGNLDPSSDKTFLDVGQKVDLPLWYAQQFSSSRLRSFRVEIPDTYKKVCKEICEADANAVDLKKMNKYFYEFGRYLIGYDRVDTVGPLLFETCRQRCRHLMDLCKVETSGEIKVDNKMDNTELNLFANGCKQNEKFSKWLHEDTSSIETAGMVINHKKRKLAERELI